MPLPRTPYTVASLTLAALLTGTPSLGAMGQAPPDAAQRVDEIFAPWDASTSAGCAVGVVQHDLTVLERAYGMADLEHAVPNTSETIFEGGSLSKQFTAAAVVLLALDGKLALDDDVRAYVPEIPDYGRTITLRHLMTHTSGLRDWGSVADISGWGREQRSHDHDDVLDILGRQSALNFDPGHEYSYSNSGYNLLAIVVARVSGVPFADFSRRRIFEPLGLGHTQWRDDYRRIVANRSTAYDASEGGWSINRPIEHVHGNGGILTTVRDLGVWNQALTDGRLGGADFVRMMHEPGLLADGSPIVYAGGLRVEPYRGVPSVTHTGSTAGYRAFLGRYPEQGLSVAMLCNASNVPTGATGARIADIYLGDAADDPANPDVEGASAGRDLGAFAGLYRDPVTGEERELSVEGGVLSDGSTPLLPLSDRDFQVGTSDRRYVFSSGAGSPSTAFRVEDWAYTDQRYERVEPWTPEPSDLAAFAGSYHSADAETTYVVRPEGDGLVLWQRPNVLRSLSPVYQDAFRTGGMMIRFRRDDSGRVTGLSLGLGRVYDMRFMRMEG
jgi:CubicO group peptidase (beta-lactamase class C family)